MIMNNFGTREPYGENEAQPDFILTQKEHEILGKFLSTVPRVCSQCGKEAGTESARFSIPAIDYARGEMQFPDSDFIAVSCAACGYTRFFRALKIGLARRPPVRMS